MRECETHFRGNKIVANDKKNFTLVNLEQRYGKFYTVSNQVDFVSSDVPGTLLTLIPYAKFWGLSDDWEREQLVAKAPDEIKNELKLLIVKYDDFLDEWLAGEEAGSPLPSDAYVAFSAMRMCADFM